MKNKNEPAKNRWPKYLGAGFVDKANEVVLRVGKLSWTRLQMASQLNNVDYIAARDFVTPVLEELGVNSVEMIWGTDSSRFWRRKVPGKPKRLHIVSMNVLMSLIKHVLHRNPYKWVAGMNEDLVTLATLKNREKVRQLRAAKTKQTKVRAA